jgi:hypothetical protein
VNIFGLILSYDSKKPGNQASCYRIFLVKSRISQLVKKLHAFIEPVSLSPFPEKSVIVLYAEEPVHILCIIYVIYMFISRDSPVGIATGYGLDGRGSIPSRGKRFLCSPRSPDRLRGPAQLLYNGYGGFLPGGKAARA